jgi:FKBP-type peptidyl-prolyl cis-trans isomerase
MLLVAAALSAGIVLTGCGKQSDTAQAPPTPPAATLREAPPITPPQQSKPTEPVAGKSSKASPDILAARTLGSKSDKSVVKTPSGLQYIDVKVGAGKAVKNGDMVDVNYTGWLTSGMQFDSSIGRGPFSFPVGAGRVIKGWDEGVAGMKLGGVRKLIVPSELGYGTRGAGADIPPSATLIFEVELLRIQ